MSNAPNGDGNGNGNGHHDSSYKPVWLNAKTAGAATAEKIGSNGLSKKEILKQRTKILAQQQNVALNEDTIEVAEFLLGGETYAFELENLREVCPLADVTYIPCSPPFVVGVINLRGQIIPIIDLLSFLDIDRGRITVFNKAIILHRGSLIIGFLADEVIGARKIPSTALQTSLSVLSGLSADYLRGITRDRLVVLDAARILNDKRLNVER